MTLPSERTADLTRFVSSSDAPISAETAAELDGELFMPGSCAGLSLSDLENSIHNLTEEIRDRVMAIGDRVQAHLYHTARHGNRLERGAAVEELSRGTAQGRKWLMECLRISRTFPERAWTAADGTHIENVREYFSDKYPSWYEAIANRTPVEGLPWEERLNRRLEAALRHADDGVNVTKRALQAERAMTNSGPQDGFYGATEDQPAAWERTNDCLAPTVLTEHENPEALDVKPGLWRHCEGSVYEVLWIATHTEDHEVLVIYRNSRGEWFAQPLPIFLGNVVNTLTGEFNARFTWLGEKERER